METYPRSAADDPVNIPNSGRFVAFFEVVLGISKTEGRRTVHRLGELRLFGSGRAPVTIWVGLLCSRILWLTGLDPLCQQNAEIVLCMLQIVLGHDAVARRARIARKLEIFFIDMRRGAPDFYVRSRRIECPAVIVLRPAAASTRTFHVYPSVLDFDGAGCKAKQSRMHIGIVRVLNAVILYATQFLKARTRAISVCDFWRV